jgi:hypothetical protein
MLAPSTWELPRFVVRRRFLHGRLESSCSGRADGLQAMACAPLRAEAGRNGGICGSTAS